MRGPYTARTGPVTGPATMQVFYDELSPYGDWVHNREYGFVWIPHTGPNFYPYGSNGSWIYTDYGWTWLSDYPWGWAAFHYGRWDFDPQYGWFWFPGTEWAPAWVIWRQGEGYYGWTPMRPQASWDYRSPADTYRWIFVRDKDFGRSNIHRYYLNRRRNDDVISSTRIISESRPGREQFASGPDPVVVQSSSGRRIRQVTVRDSGTPGRRLTNTQLELYRPRIVSNPAGNRPSPEIITDVKDVRPMRERNRNYEQGVPSEAGQGSRETNTEQLQNIREREAREAYEQKQSEMRRRQSKTGLKQTEQSGEKEYEQTRSERIRRTDQQKRQMEQERKRNSRDTTISKRSVKVESVRKR